MVFYMGKKRRGWNYSRQELYYKLEEIIEKAKPNDNSSWETDSKLKIFRADLIKRK